jgi:hypothetical protein
MLVAPAAWSAIVYVDATPNTNGADGNTTVNGAPVELGGSAVGSVNVTTSGTGSGTNNLWRYRAFPGVAAGDNLWESDENGDNIETTAPLITTIDLGPGTYNLFGMFRVQGTTYDVAFSLDGITYGEFDGANTTAAAADGSDFLNPDDLGNIEDTIGDTFIASIGQVTLPAGGSVAIYVQGPDRDLGTDPVNSGQRTRYEGVGYELVPEPTSLLLLSLGVSVAGIVRRRKHSI